MLVLENRYKEIENRYQELSKELSRPEVIADYVKYRELNKEFSYLSKIYNLIQKERDVNRQLEEAKLILEETDDDELLLLAEEEIESLEEKAEQCAKQIKLAIVPPDPDEGKNIIMEIRAGTGGDEAALFAGDLFRCYQRYAERKKWKLSIMERHESEIGGFKEVIASIEGETAYTHLQYESGAHRVQRVPVTESSGRIHTSAITVAIFPEAEEVDVDIDEQDLRIDVFRSSGPGGQHVNKTESAVRITHVPTGIVVSCQDEKSQHKNKNKAMRVLRARLYQQAKEQAHQERAMNRRSQVGTGDRSEKIRTYNYPQSRVTDHRIGLTLYKLTEIMDGDLDELTDALDKYFKEKEFEELIAESVGS